MKTLSKTVTTMAASVLATAALCSCAGKGPSSDKTTAVQPVVLDPTDISPFNDGVFQGWGTSFCWWANRIGYDDELSQQAADLFYDAQKGIGLNIIRYNIGGGDDPSHTHITRTDSMMPGFMVIDPKTGERVWDWDADAAQRNVMRRAVKACGQDVIVEAFSNSPPYFMTVSGCSSGSVGAKYNNLKDDEYAAFADYLVQVVKHLQESDGIKFQSLDPMNEPFTDYWGAMSWKQEGCHFDQKESQSRMILETRRALAEQGLSDIILCGTDETNVDVQIDSLRLLSDEAKVALDRVDTHTYGGTNLVGLRQAVADEGKNLWMSEVDGDGVLGGTRAGEMGSALWFAQKIIDDIHGLRPSAWIMWQVIDNHISKEGYKGRKDSGAPDTKKGFWGLTITNHDTKKIILTKKYYAYGQFTKFIRPGSMIIGSSRDSLAAYDSSRKQAVVVVVNQDNEEKEYAVSLENFASVGKTAYVYRTCGTLHSGENMEEKDGIKLRGKVLETVLAPLSITTFVVDGVLK